MKSVLITVADFKRLLEAAEVTIDDPAVLIAPKKSDRSYQSHSPKSVLSHDWPKAKNVSLPNTNKMRRSEYMP